MSTFGGCMPEFPDIRVDYFRTVSEKRPPLACFLSHVHSDHLAGLESLKSPFIYCSAATREILLRLERHPHRINFQLGILESRKQHYKHLKNILKPIPLETPTRIEIAPDNFIQVTLFDANHCPGAVMFLLEGNGKAVLYTGDIRSEPWFVNNIIRNPFIVEYATGLKTLDCIYLDTSFTNDISFPTKAEGLKELLQKVKEYPVDTVFHLSAWTFGYEEVWMALSKALNSQVHVDTYKMRLYQSLRGNGNSNSPVQFLSREGAILAGYLCANTEQAGCLTLDQSVRLHSCEKGTSCRSMNDKTVYIRPIITRTPTGKDINEIGVGGGAGDLTQRLEVELESDSVVAQLLSLIASTDNIVQDEKIEIKQILMAGLHSSRKAISVDDKIVHHQEDEMSLRDLAQILTKSAKHDAHPETRIKNSVDEELPRVITFPYSRHSSYAELCHLVKAFKPKDVYPCTVDEENWHQGVSVKHLFGQYCSGFRFRHDEEMNEKELGQHMNSQNTRTSSASESPQEQELDEIDFEQNYLHNGVEDLPNASSPDQTDATIKSTVAGGEFQVSKQKMILKRDATGRLRPFNEYGVPFKSSGILNPPATGCMLSIGCSSDQTSSVQQSPNLQVDELSTEDGTLSKRPRLYYATNASGTDSESEDQISWEDISYLDPKDHVYRCSECGWELWSDTTCGFCRGDEIIEIEIPEADFNSAVFPEEFFHGDIQDHFDRAAAMGDLLEGGSDYSRSDTEARENEDYELDSFVTNDVTDLEESIDSSVSGKIEDSDTDTDFRKLYYRLLKSNRELLDDFMDVYDKYTKLVMGDSGPETRSESRHDDGEEKYGGEEHATVQIQSAAQ